MADAWDVAIAGAGPAGSALAVRLAREGHSVLLLDQARFPRKKVCGEYFGPGCLPLLAETGAAAEIARRAHPIPGIRAVSPGGVEFSATYEGPLQAFSMPRWELDWILLENALRMKTVTVREGFRTEELILEDGAVCGLRGRTQGGGVETVRARVTVGADGRNSVVARRLGVFRLHPSFRRFSVGVHLAQVEARTDGGEIYAGRGLYGILNQQGSGTANLSIVSGPDRAGLWKGRLQTGLAALLDELPALRDRLRGSRPLEKVHALGPLAHSAVRLGAPGALLIGDAARFYDPFTGEGVYMALVDARLAAETVRTALREGGLSGRLLRKHTRARRMELGLRYAAEGLVQRILACPSAADVVARQLSGRPALCQRLMEFFGGVRSTPWSPLRTT